MQPATPRSLFTLDAMQFFGRVAADYEAMFGIRVHDLQGLRVLDCPSGPGSFVAEAAARELLRVTSREVRLYPTTTRWTTPCRHPYAEAIARDCAARGMRVRYEPSTFARGNHANDTLNASLVIRP